VKIATELPKEEVRPTEAVLPKALAASPLDDPPVEEIIWLELLLLLDRAVGRILDEAAGLEPHDDAAEHPPLEAGDEEPPVIAEQLALAV